MPLTYLDGQNKFQIPIDRGPYLNPLRGSLSSEKFRVGQVVHVPTRERKRISAVEEHFDSGCLDMTVAKHDVEPPVVPLFRGSRDAWRHVIQHIQKPVHDLISASIGGRSREICDLPFAICDRFGLPKLLELNQQEVVAQLGLGESGGITSKVLLDQPELTIISVSGSIGVVTEG